MFDSFLGKRQKPLRTGAGSGIPCVPLKMKSRSFSRVLRIGSLTCALFLALHTQGLLARAGDCDEGVAQDLFQDGTKEGKDKKPKPPHRLVPAPCEGCKDLFDDLQRALDDCYALELKDAEKSLSD